MVSTSLAEPTSSTMSEARGEERERLSVGMWLIIFFKAITAVLLWGAFALLLVAGREDPQNFFSVLIFRTFRGDPPDVALRFLVKNLQFISSAMVIRLAVATVAYALVESAEAIGLYLRKEWAEWLVILVTVSFIPLEIYESVTRPNPIKIASLIGNVIILWYLLKRLFGKRAQRRRAILQQS